MVRSKKEKAGRWGFRALVARKLGSATATRTATRTAPSSGEGSESDLSTVRSNLQETESYWNRAYRALEKAQPDLIRGYEDLLSQESEKMNSTPNDDGQRTTLHPETANAANTHEADSQTRQARLDTAIEKILERNDVSSFKSHVSQAANIASSVQSFIGEAVKASPEASIAWAGVCIVLPLLTNPATAEQGHRDGLIYITTRMRYWIAFQPMLQRLAKSTGVDENLMVETESHVVNLYQELLEYQIQTVVRLHKGSLRRFVGDIYEPNIWKDRRKGIERLEAEVNKDLEQINDLAKRQQLESLNKMSDESLQKLGQLLSVAEQQAADFGKTMQLLQNQAQEEMSEKQTKCHQLFRQVNSGNETTYEWYKDRVEESVTGTCQWFLGHDTFQRWSEQDSGMLLVSADPGCGKSVLAKRLIDHELPSSANICYFFFKDQDQNTTLNRALCALLHQLFKCQPALIQHAMPAYRSDGEGLVHNRSSLWTILQTATQDTQAKPTIIILDALDECFPAEFGELMRSLKRYFYSTQSDYVKVKYLLTSRPYNTILEAFRDFPHVRIPGEEKSDDISREVDLVIKHRANELKKRKGLSDSQTDLLVRKLCETPQRTYLWVYLLFDHLKTADFKITAQGILSQIEKLPKTVHEAYESILNKSQKADMARKVLGIILAAVRPLSVAEMNCAVNADDGDNVGYLDLEQEAVFEQRLRNWCGLLVSIYHRRVYFLHTTVNEFLQGNESSERTDSKCTPEWCGSITQIDAEAILARCCVTYLDLFNRDGIPLDARDSDSEEYRVHEGDSDEDNSDGDDSDGDDSHRHGLSDQRTAFLRYAAKNWGEHCRESSTTVKDSPTVSSILRVCDPHSKAYSAWLPIFLFSFDQNEARVNEAAEANFTTLITASLMGLQAVVKHLLDGLGCSDLEATDGLLYGFTPLLWAVYGGHEVVVGQLLAKNANFEAKDNEGSTPLLLAINKGHYRIINQLFEKKADIETRNNDGFTPLILALKLGKGDAALELLAKGANIEAYSLDGRTPLMWAVEKYELGDLPVRLLLEKGAKVNVRDHSGRTALSRACKYGIAKLLLEKGAEPNAKGGDGRELLMWAVTRRA